MYSVHVSRSEQEPKEAAELGWELGAGQSALRFLSEARLVLSRGGAKPIPGPGLRLSPRAESKGSPGTVSPW